MAPLGARDALGYALAIGFASLLLRLSADTPIPVADIPTYLALVQEGVFDVDARTWAAGRRFVNGSWLAQRLYGWVFDAAGWAGLSLMHLGSLALALGLSAWAAARRAGGPGAALAMGLALLLMTGNTAARPQTWVLPLALGVWLSPSALLTGGLAALWGNLHGSVALAPLIALAAGRPKAAAAASLGLLCTPWGFGLFEYLWLNSARPAARGLDEWSAPGAAGGYALRLALAVGIIGAVAGMTRRAAAQGVDPARVGAAPRRGAPGDRGGLSGAPAPRVGEALLLLSLLALSLSAVRHALWLGLLGGAVVGAWPARRPGPPWRVAALALLGSLLVGGALTLGGVSGVLSRARQPFGAQAPTFLVQGPPPAGITELNAPFELGGLARLRWGVRTPVDVRVWLPTGAEWARYLAQRIEPSANPVLLCEDREPELARATEGWVELHREGCWALRRP